MARGVVRHLTDVNTKGAKHDSAGGGEDALDEGAGEYAGIFGAGRA